MPPDHLTTPPHHASHGRVLLDATAVAAGMSPAAEAVRAVLGGADPGATAAAIGLRTEDLHDALNTYHVAGLSAVDQSADAAWYQANVQFTGWNTAETVVAYELGPRLDALQAAGAVRGWWFLRKHPCWRLRFLHAEPAAVGTALDELTNDGWITRWWPGTYEAETAAFGGTHAMEVIHELFRADSAGVLTHLRQTVPAVRRRELSLLLLGVFLRATGLDPFERGDVFARTARLRPAPAPGDLERIQPLIDGTRTMLTLPEPAISDLFAADGPAGHAGPWLTAFSRAGRRLGEVAGHGALGRGLRAVCTHIVIFHWNRLGLTTTRQALLAHAATAALLPPE